MYENRIAHLEEAHQSLDKQITGLEKIGKVNDNYINELKKKKLQLKDEISVLKRKQWEHDHESVDFDDER